MKELVEPYEQPGALQLSSRTQTLELESATSISDSAAVPLAAILATACARGASQSHAEQEVTRKTHSGFGGGRRF